MSRENPKINPSPIFKKRGGFKTLSGDPVLTQKDIKRILAAQILGGLVANSKNAKFEPLDLSKIAVECAEHIIDLTE